MCMSCGGNKPRPTSKPTYSSTSGSKKVVTTSSVRPTSSFGKPRVKATFGRKK